MLWIIKYLGMLTLRPTASSSPENSHFSEKLLSNCTESALEHSMFSFSVFLNFAILSDLFTWKNSHFVFWHWNSLHAAHDQKEKPFIAENVTH